MNSSDCVLYEAEAFLRVSTSDYSFGVHLCLPICPRFRSLALIIRLLGHRGPRWAGQALLCLQLSETRDCAPKLVP